MDKLNNKIPPPLLAIASAVLIWVSTNYLPIIYIDHSLRLFMAGLLFLSGVAVSFAGWYAFHKANTTVNPLAPETASHLVSSGVYRFTRNPMYLGLSMWLTGLSVFLSNPGSLMVVIFFILYINRFQIHPEEKALKKVFGDEFVRYSESVRRWI